MAAPGSEPTILRVPADDAVITFRTARSGITGRLVRLGSAADGILARHNAPEWVSVQLGEALALAALLGSALPGEGKIILQTRTDGLVRFIVADYDAPGKLRGYVRFDKEKIAERVAAGGRIELQTLLGNGHLAITIDEGPSRERYQGIVALDGGSLAEGATHYFERSEDLPTLVRLAVARHFKSGHETDGSQWHWRAGGIMLQHKLGTHAGGKSGGLADRAAGSSGTRPDDEDWVRVRTLAETIEDHELLDPLLTPERLLLRLFHEEGVIVQRARPLSAHCRCSRERVISVLKSFAPDEFADMRDEAGHISATCEFCATTYVFDPSELTG